MNIWTLVHGDDYWSAGTSKSLVWLQSISEERYEIKTQRIGKGPDGKGVQQSTEGQVLNRVVRYSPGGCELEADFRHAELVIEQLGLEHSKAVVTPGIDQDDAITCSQIVLTSSMRSKKFAAGCRGQPRKHGRT